MAAQKHDWENTVKDCIEDFTAIEGLNPLLEVLEASQEHQLEIYPAALVYHAQSKEKNSQTKKKGVKKNK